MTSEVQPQGGGGPPWHVGQGALRAVITHGGGLASLTTGGLELVQHAASAFEPGMVQLWLRDRAAGGRVGLLGAGSGSNARPAPTGVVVSGRTGADDDVATGRPDGGLRWRAELVLGPRGDGSPAGTGSTAWAWHVTVANTGEAAREIDLVHTHDVALATPGALRANELYVSQYLDLTPLAHEGGIALAVRQNQPQAGSHPWCVLACDRRITHWATDALDLHGVGPRSPQDRTQPGSALDGDLPARRLQHEHTLVALQTEPMVLAAGESASVTFAGLVLDDHPDATGPGDLAHVRTALTRAAETAAAAFARATETAGAALAARADGGPDALPDGGPDGPDGTPGLPAPLSLYALGRELLTRDLTDTELEGFWPGTRQVVEHDTDEQVLSYFLTAAGEPGGTGDIHVVTRAKELGVLRPHGTILRSGDAAAPDPAGLTVTAWMTGSPLSYLTRGHATTGRVLTTVRGYLNLHRAYGLRLFVEVDGHLRLLDLPSAFAMTLDGAHWVYAFDPSGTDPGGVVEVRTMVPAHERRASVQVDVVGGPARRVLVALHLAGPQDPAPLAPGAVRVETGPQEPDAVVVRVPDVASPDGPGVALTVRASRAVQTSDDGVLFADGVGRDGGVVTLDVPADAEQGLRLDLSVEREGAAELAAAAASGEAALDGEAAHDGEAWWHRMTGFRLDGPGEVEALGVSLPWLVRDALVHHLSPRGLEQYTGGAWGTRDVTQGPLELLLALDRLHDARLLLRQVFAAQNTDGSWPQAFGFLPGDEHFRHEPPHGDVVHWPVLALGRYLLASGDAEILTDEVPWYVAPAAQGAAQGAAEGPAEGEAAAPTGRAAPSTVLDHVLRAIDRARAGFLPGTHLVSYGHGDWNDSLQPADPTMTRTMTSAWTVTLHHQALTALADGLGAPDAAEELQELAGLLRAEAVEIAADLHRHLLVDGELAGYALLAAATPQDERVVGPRLLVHPRDDETGLRHGALQMIHALGAELFDTEQAAHHIALLREHLSGADGVRLFDRPPGYHGGLMHHFQRAETATFVGREIGLMYIHAHLRWIEALALWGDAESAWHAIQQVLPAATPAVVPGARRRQANAYASSSDAAVADRAEFAERYAEVLTGEVGFEGGWRVYSSGPGVLLRVLTHSVIGVRRRGSSVVIDPVLPARLDGLRAEVPLDGGLLRLRFRVGSRGHGPDDLRLGGHALEGVRVPNPYRPGGLSVRLADLAEALRPDGPELEVHVP